VRDRAALRAAWRGGVLLGDAAVPGLLDAVRTPVAAPPKFAFVKTPLWDRVDADARAAITQLVARLGDAVGEQPMPADAAGAWDWQRTVMETEIAYNYDAEWTRGRDRLSASLQSQIERGRITTAFDYQRALAEMSAVNAAFDPLYAEFDAVLTPAVPGAAPRGLDSTGDPAFCTLWTFCGMPVLTLPLLKGANGLPLGVQLVGPRLGDARLLRAARWLTGAMPGA